METVHVLLIDISDSCKSFLETPTLADGSVHYAVSFKKPTALKNLPQSERAEFDVILFGEKIGVRTVIEHARTFRLQGQTVPMFILTKTHETMVPKNLQKVGIDGMLNVDEMNTPLFSWTFMSAVKQTENRRKAKEFDDLAHRFESLEAMLATITHDINNPLSVIRLALYHLENMDPDPEKRNMLFKLLNDNMDKIDGQMDELRTLRRLLRNEQTPPSAEESLSASFKPKVDRQKVS